MLTWNYFSHEFYLSIYFHSSAYESEYDNYRPGMASDEDYFVVEPVSDVDLELFDDINLEEVTVSDKYDIDVHDFINMNSMTRKQITEV